MARRAHAAAAAGAGTNGTTGGLAAAPPGPAAAPPGPGAAPPGPKMAGGAYPTVALGAGLTARLMTITPRLAAEWLAESPRVQRARGRTAIEMIGRALDAGEWKLNGATIVFGRDGRLYDGQHRLAAVVLSGKPAISVVVWGVAPAAFDTMDVGKGARTAGDALHAAGYSYATAIGAAAQYLYRVEHGLRSHDRATRSTRVRLSPAEVHRFVEGRPRLRVAARRAQPCFRRLGSCGVVVAAYYACDRVDAAAAEQFFEGLVEGVGLERGSPILALRDRADSRQGERWDADQVWWAIVTAWNAWRAGESINPKGWRYLANEPRPVPV